MCSSDLPICHFIPHAPFGSDQFLHAVQKNNFDLLCHHGADVTNYKSPDFDAHRALHNNTRNLQTVLVSMKQQGLKAVILTGTVFENDEGAGTEPLCAASPYGQSKGLTFQTFRDQCGAANVALGKFVIPNPFGPFEEARFTAYLMRSWQAGKVAEVKTPDYVRDNIHVDLLAAVYAKFAREIYGANVHLLKINPSGYIESQGEFAQRVACEVKSRTSWACELKLSRQIDFSEPIKRINTQPAAKVVPDWTEAAAWDAFADFYSQ